MNVLLPRTLEALFEALEDPAARILAGGTDLLVRLRSAARPRPRICACPGAAPQARPAPVPSPAPSLLVGLERIPELRGVSRTRGLFRIGAMETHAALLARPEVRRRLPALAQALAVLGSPPVRTMATIGGNVCTASPAGDTLPPLLAHEARVELLSGQGARVLPLSDFLLGPGRTALARGEILAALHLPEARGFALQRFEKAGLRAALAIAVVSLAALVRLDSGGKVAEVRLALGSAAPTVLRCPQAEAQLLGRRLTPAALARAASTLRREASPVDDLRATAAHRRQVAGNLLERLLLPA